MLNSGAITKIQSIILIAVVVVAAVGGAAAYVLLSGEEPSSETIKIGYLSFIGEGGHPGWYGLRGVEWAVEQINAEGGILGRPLEVVAEDTKPITSDNEAIGIQTAMTKLIAVHEVDFIITGSISEEALLVCQDQCAEHKKILLCPGSYQLFRERVADNYDKYKYSFVWRTNDTVGVQTLVDSLVTLREYSGFNKIALISDDTSATREAMATLEAVLPTYDFEIVYANSISSGTLDPSSYLAQAEAAGAEILVPYLYSQVAFPFAGEWYNRQSPTVMWGSNIWISGYGSLGALDRFGWKCDYMTSFGDSFQLGYALTSKTLPIREAYIERWGEDPQAMEGWTYDIMRYILADALERAGTTETDEVIKALEETSVETVYYPQFAFTSSHEVLIKEGVTTQVYFQWQNRTLVPVYPKEAMEEAGATYIYPDWPGPWNK